MQNFHLFGWYHQPKAQEGSFLCLLKSFSSTDLAVQVLCLSSLLPIDPACSVMWWHPQSHLFHACLGSPSIPCSTHGVQPLLTQVVAICSPRNSPWWSPAVVLVLCLPFHLAFLVDFLQERNSSHTGYKPLVVGGCGVLAREKAAEKLD